MKQIVRAIQLFTDKLKSYIAVGLIVVLVPSFAVAENLFPKKETENTPTKETENVVPNMQPPKNWWSATVWYNIHAEQTCSLQ